MDDYATSFFEWLEPSRDGFALGLHGTWNVGFVGKPSVPRGFHRMPLQGAY